MVGRNYFNARPKNCIIANKDFVEALNIASPIYCKGEPDIFSYFNIASNPRSEVYHPRNVAIYAKNFLNDQIQKIQSGINWASLFT